MMHQKIESDEARLERIRDDFDVYLDGWTDAERREPCLPPETCGARRQRLYVNGWATKRALMLEGG